MSDLFRPRRRPRLRLALGTAVSVVLVAAALGVVWLRTHVVPPDCGDPRTLALVRQSLIGQFGLPPSVSIEQVEMRAGGYLAFRFACEATLHGIDPRDLPPGAPIPGTVSYISRLTDDGQRQEVTVSIQPLLRLERVQ